MLGAEHETVCGLNVHLVGVERMLIYGFMFCGYLNFLSVYKTVNKLELYFWSLVVVWNSIFPHPKVYQSPRKYFVNTSSLLNRCDDDRCDDSRRINYGFALVEMFIKQRAHLNVKNHSHDHIYHLNLHGNRKKLQDFFFTKKEKF